jgi:hypothetical protein
MNLAPQPHPGLPVIPHPGVGELLGSWLLRVSQVYGLDLGDLLVCLGVLPSTSRWSPSWYELHHGHMRCAQLASALRRPVDLIAAMSAPRCERLWPSELGFCGRCLDESTSDGAPHRWMRRWMHPIALACEEHRAWLEPVTTKRLREIRTIGDIAQLHRKATEWSALEWRRESALIDSALWFERIIINPAEHHPPWGKTEPNQLAKIVRSLVQVLMAPAAADLVRHQLGRSIRDLPERRQRWACQTFRVDDGVRGTVSLSAPDCLRHRQFVFGLLGHFLRLSPANRAPLEQLTKLIASEIPAWQLARWPQAAAEWVSPGSSRKPPLSLRRRRPTRAKLRPPAAPTLFGA